MAFFKSLLSRLLPDSKLLDDNSGDHYDRLERIRINYDWIDVTISKNKQCYQSLILEIDIANHELLIDDLYPPIQLDQIEAGDRVKISCQSNHAELSFYSRILARELRDGEACYRLELPEAVGINHSRSAYRVYVENERALRLAITLEGEPLQNVRIINLSTQGLKFSFAKEMADQLQQKRQLSDCVIHLPEGYAIDCDIELINIYRIHTPEPHTLGAGMLIIKQPQHRVKLQQYLAGIQRKQRRREIHTN
jgi:c-di-GMP-binding flagellar brake protein YcgR